MNVLGLIPARGGSKGVLRKNIKILKGKPLIWYTAKAALESEGLARIILSTEDELIAQVGRDCGLDVPFLRPRDLAEDHSPTLPVIQHAVQILEKDSDRFDAVCLLQPTSPFRDSLIIEECLKCFVESGSDSLITLLKVPEKFNPYFMYFQDEDGHMEYFMGNRTRAVRRQEVPPAYVREGSVYITKRDVIMEQNSLYGKSTVGYLMQPEKSINIDSMEDWHLAEKMMAELDNASKENTDS